MSFWWVKREEDGSRSLMVIDVPIQLIIMVAGMLLLLFVFPPFLPDYKGFVKNSVYTIVGGFALILISKISLLKRGIWSSWGPGRMTKPFKSCYFIGYILIGIGIIRILVAASL